MSVSSTREQGARGAWVAEIGSESGLVLTSCGVWRCWQRVPHNAQQTGSGGLGQLPRTDVALRVVWALVTAARAPPRHGWTDPGPVQVFLVLLLVGRRGGCSSSLLPRPSLPRCGTQDGSSHVPAGTGRGQGGGSTVGQTFGRWARGQRRLPLLETRLPETAPPSLRWVDGEPRASAPRSVADATPSFRVACVRVSRAGLRSTNPEERGRGRSSLPRMVNYRRLCVDSTSGHLGRLGATRKQLQPRCEAGVGTDLI